MCNKLQPREGFLLSPSREAAVGGDVRVVCQLLKSGCSDVE